MRVYLAGPMTHTEDEGAGWMKSASDLLRHVGITPVLPMPTHEYTDRYMIRAEVVDKVLTIRDKWAATTCDVILANFSHAIKASIGTSIELGWASQAGVPIVGVVPEGNVHEHPMVLSLLSIRTLDLGTAVRAVVALNGGKIFT